MKIENRSDSPLFTRAAGDNNQLNSSRSNESPSYVSSTKSQSSSQPHRASIKSSTCRLDDPCCPHGAAKPVKSRCASPPRPGDVRSRSRSPTSSHLARSRSHHSRHSVDIKTECTTPTMHKKSSRYHVFLATDSEYSINRSAFQIVCLKSMAMLNILQQFQQQLNLTYAVLIG